MLLPMAFDPVNANDDQWVRVIFVPLILGLTCLSANELTRRLRSRVLGVQRLRREQEALLVAAQDHLDVLAAWLWVAESERCENAPVEWSLLWWPTRMTM